jgi:hypothetical protein
MEMCFFDLVSAAGRFAGGDTRWKGSAIGELLRRRLALMAAGLRVVGMFICTGADLLELEPDEVE